MTSATHVVVNVTHVWPERTFVTLSPAPAQDAGDRSPILLTAAVTKRGHHRTRLRRARRPMLKSRIESETSRAAGPRSARMEERPASAEQVQSPRQGAWSERHAPPRRPDVRDLSDA